MEKNIGLHLACKSGTEKEAENVRNTDIPNNNKSAKKHNNPLMAGMNR